MAYLSNEAKAELLKLLNSGYLREDMRKVSTRYYSLPADTPEAVDSAIRFLSEINRVAGHPRKPFKPMTGDHFVL